MKIRLAQSAMQKYDIKAEQNARLLAKSGVFAVDVMGSPGAGKTEILERTVEAMVQDMTVGVIEGDICTERDADRVRASGAQAVQINTEGACHLDAHMVGEVLENMTLGELDLLFIENVGNLICPTRFRSGAAERAIVLSLPEGTDKPEKYPSMFRSCAVTLVNKIDLIDVLPVDLAELTLEIRRVNPHMRIWPVCARTAQGMEGWYEWLREGVRRSAAGR